jgi:hypothetical protein
MAQRVEANSPETSAAEQAAEDLAVMFPDSSITIAGEAIIVTEYPFLQWLQLKPLHSEFLDDLAELVGHSEEGITTDELMEFFEDQFEHVQALIAASIDRPLAFFKPLKSDEVDTLMLTWWHVNKNFFLKSVHRARRKQNKVLSAGQTSTKP